MNRISKDPFRLFLILVSACFLTVCLADTLFQACDIYSKSFVEIETSGTGEIWIVENDTSQLPCSLKELYDQSIKTNGWVYLDAQKNGLTCNAIMARNAEKMELLLPTDPLLTFAFLKGNTCGEILVTTGNTATHIDLFDEQPYGVEHKYRPFESSITGYVVRFIFSLVVFLFIVLLMLFCTDKATLNESRTYFDENHRRGRETGMDLVRTVAACFVIAVHGIMHYGYYDQPLDDIGAWGATFFRWLFFCCVALYFMITGYFLNKRELTLRHYLRLENLIVSYVIISIISIYFSGYQIQQTISISEVLRRIVTYQESGFLSQYVCLYLLIPFLNTAWNNMNQNGHQALLAVCLVLTSLYPGIKVFIPRIFLECYPITFYYLGAYISKYKPMVNKRFVCIWLFIWLISVSIGSIAAANGGIFDWGFLTVSGLGYQMFPNVMITVLVFLMLYDCELKNARICSMLKQVSTHSFEIYMFSGVFDSVIFGILRRNVSASFNVQILYLPLTTFASLLLSLGAAWLLKKQLSIIKMCCAFVFERLKS